MFLNDDNEIYELFSHFKERKHLSLIRLHGLTQRFCCFRLNLHQLHVEMWQCGFNGNVLTGKTLTLILRQESKKLGKFLGKWNGETETRKLNGAKQSNL